MKARARSKSRGSAKRMRARRRAMLAALVVVAQLASSFSFTGCKREERSFRVAAPLTSREVAVRVSELQPGPASPTKRLENGYEENAYAVSEGQRLYHAFNCVGCHANGGGSMGPPLLDEKWRYGSDPDQIYLTIMQGRPNGMPSFAGKLNRHQAWQLVAFVRSLSGLTPRDAAPNRQDHMKSSPPPNSVAPLQPTGEAPKHPGQ